MLVVDVAQGERERSIFRGVRDRLVVPGGGEREKIFCKGTIEAQSGLPDRTAFHFGDEGEDVPADAARASRDAGSGLTGPYVPSETDGEAVFASGRRVRRKRAF